MFDSQRKTAQLFDKGNTTQFYYNTNLATSSQWDYYGTGIVIRIPCDVNTTYTISCDIDTTVWRISTVATDNVPTSGYSVPSFDVVRSKPANGVYTFTTQNNAKYILFQIGASVFDAGLDVLMLNTGSTPLPYEPYWQHSLRKLGTSTDTITTLPADVYADGNNATVGLKGQMVQSSTPSPTTPIQPQECGDRTGNLFNYQTMSDGLNNYYLDKYGVEQSSNSWVITDYIPVNGRTFSLTRNAAGFSPSICLYDSAKNFLAGEEYNGNTVVTLTAEQDVYYVRFSHYKSNQEDLSQAMLNVGQPISYEPYGIKIPILSANTTTPVYLGEVQSTRKIKKLVFDGTEDWTYAPNGQYQRVRIDLGDNAAVTNCMCNQYPYIFTFSECNIFVHSNLTQLSICDSVNATSLTNWTTYLVQQYAAGTPVCVWYVLATETTGILNEPLRKIGDYADTISGISIPTTTGADSFDVLTTLKPSEVSLAYTGWHDASAKEWDGSEWQ